jgi:hypothetical protein
MTTVVAWAAAEQPRMIVAIAVLTKRMIDTPFDLPFRFYD